MLAQAALVEEPRFKTLQTISPILGIRVHQAHRHRVALAVIAAAANSIRMQQAATAAGLVQMAQTAQP